MGLKDSCCAKRQFIGVLSSTAQWQTADCFHWEWCSWLIFRTLWLPYQPSFPSFRPPSLPSFLPCSFLPPFLSSFPVSLSPSFLIGWKMASKRDHRTTGLVDCSEEMTALCLNMGNLIKEQKFVNSSQISLALTGEDCDTQRMMASFSQAKVRVGDSFMISLVRVSDTPWSPRSYQYWCGGEWTCGNWKDAAWPWACCEWTRKESCPHRVPLGMEERHCLCHLRAPPRRKLHIKDVGQRSNSMRLGCLFETWVHVPWDFSCLQSVSFLEFG